MRNSIFNKQIPTALGLFLIIAGLSITTFLTSKPTSFQSSATESKQPLEVRISNITGNSFTVSYKTSSLVSGILRYGLDQTLAQTAYDDNDQIQKLQNHNIHSITLKNLSPLTNYYFSIISGGDTYLNNNQNFQVTTTKISTGATADNIMSGKIILPDSSAPKEAIVYLTTYGSQVLSTLTKTDGTYAINLKNLLTQDLNQNLNLTNDSVIEEYVLSENMTSNAKFYYSQNKNVPVITLSNNYDFRVKQESSSANTNANPDSFPLFNNTKTLNINNKLQIITPTNNQNLSNQKPIIKGLAAPNQNVKIIIHSDQPIQSNVTTDSNGNWSYQPSTPLTPGTHTITVTSKDSKGTSSTITQTFNIGDESSESSLMQTTPTTKPTNQILPSPTAVDPTKSLLANNNTSIITAGIVGLLITIVSGLIFLLSRKGI